MTDPDQTLAAIDTAIDGWTDYDYETSPDAMRWTPEPPEPQCSDKPLLLRGNVYVSAPDMAWMHVTPQQAEAVRHLAEHVTQQYQVWLRAVQQRMKRIAEAAAHAHAVLAPDVYGDEYRRHRRSCRACNPAGNPKPSKVNAHDYARRRRNRRRRRA